MAGLRQFARQLGLEKDTIEHFGIFYSVKKHNVQIPIHNINGNVIGLYEISIDSSGETIYRAPKLDAMKKSSEVYWLHHVLGKLDSDEGINKLQREGLTIVPGFEDVWMLYQRLGNQNTVALMQGWMSDKQREIILKVAKKYSTHLNIFTPKNHIISPTQALQELAYHAPVKLIGCPPNSTATKPRECSREELIQIFT